MRADVATSERGYPPIAYEEYTPYGSSAYRSSRSGVEVSARRYRYVGLERDDETGLYSMGARYYAAWLGRWTSADPLGIGADGPGLYNYTRGSPIGLVDPRGTDAVDALKGAAESLGLGGYAEAGKAVVGRVQDEATLASADRPSEVPENLRGEWIERHTHRPQAEEWTLAEPQAEEPGLLQSAGEFVYGGLASMVAGALGADMGAGEYAEKRQADWAAFDENPNAAEPGLAESLRTRTNQDLEASLHIASYMGPGILLKHLGRGAVAAEGMASAGTRMSSSNALAGVEKASPELLEAVAKRRTIQIVAKGSEEERYLNVIGAEANVGGEDMTHILLRPEPSKAALLEEFLHGTQHKVGVIKRLGTAGAETHVKDFMIRHQKMLGLGEEDVRRLIILRDMGL